MANPDPRLAVTALSEFLGAGMANLPNNVMNNSGGRHFGYLLIEATGISDPLPAPPPSGGPANAPTPADDQRDLSLETHQSTAFPVCTSVPPIVPSPRGRMASTARFIFLRELGT